MTNTTTAPKKFVVGTSRSPRRSSTANNETRSASGWIAKALLIAAVSVLAWPATSTARTVLQAASPADQPFTEQAQRFVDESLLRSPNETVKVRVAPCPEDKDASACVVWHNAKRITLYMDPAQVTFIDPSRNNSDDDRLRTRLLVLHEIGHVWDLTSKRRFHRYRHRFADLFGYPRQWFDPLNVTWEKWAMVYAWCAVNEGPGVAESVFPGYAIEPFVWQRQRMCGLMPRR